jgi:hypothetical protein
VVCDGDISSRALFARFDVHPFFRRIHPSISPPLIVREIAHILARQGGHRLCTEIRPPRRREGSHRRRGLHRIHRPPRHARERPLQGHLH